MLNYVKHKFNQMNAYEYLDISSAFLLVGVHGNPSGESRPPPPPAGTMIPDDDAHQFQDPRVTVRRTSENDSPFFHEFAETTFNGQRSQTIYV